MHTPAQVRAANGLWQAAERTERQQVSNTCERFVRLEHERSRPGRQPARSPGRNAWITRSRQNSESGCIHIVARFSVRLCEQPFDKPNTGSRWQFRMWISGETFPEPFFRTLFAAAEERPPDAPLVILRSRQGKRCKRNVALMLEPTGVPGELRRPTRTIS